MYHKDIVDICKRFWYARTQEQSEDQILFSSVGKVRKNATKKAAERQKSKQNGQNIKQSFSGRLSCWVLICDHPTTARAKIIQWEKVEKHGRLQNEKWKTSNHSFLFSGPVSCCVLIWEHPTWYRVKRRFRINIARGTTDPGYWVYNLNHVSD